MAYSGAFHRSGQERRPDRAGEPAPRPGPGNGPGGPAGALGAIMKRLESAELETDDLLLALILYLMYRESGDKDLLIMLGAMFL